MTQIWTLEHIFWLVYSLSFVVGDTATTMLGLEIKGVSEGNGLAAYIFNRVGRLGDFTAIVIAKAIVTVLLYASTLQLPQKFQTALVGIISLMGVVIVLNNIYVIWSAKA